MPSCSVHEVYAWMEEVTSSNSCALGASCRREFEKVCFCFLWYHPKSVMHVRSIHWFVRLATFVLYVSLAHQAIDWFFQGKGVVVQILGHAQDFVIVMMDSNQDSVVFYYKTTMWSCLSGTACSHVCRRTSSCFGACYLSSFPENLATPSRRFVL